MSFRRLVVLSLLLLVGVVCLPGMAVAQKEEGPVGAPFPGAPSYWEQLSNAGQLRAYLRYLQANGLLPAAHPRTPQSPDASLPNPLVNNPAADATAQATQSEATISLAGGTNLVASFNDSGSFLGGVQSFTGYSTSTDNGATWTDRGNVPELTDDNFGDPILARDNTTGRIYLSTLAGGANGMNIYRSTDNGVTWSGLANGAPGALSSGTDKEWITVDNFVGAGNGNVYHVYRDFGGPNGIYFTRSTDQGVTFSAPTLITSGAAGNVQGAHVAVGADHAVYATFYDSRGAPDAIRMRKSTDLGLTWIAGETLISNLITTGTNGSLNIPAGYRSSAFPQMVPNPAAASNLYVVYPDITVAGGSNSNIFFRQSTDGGATWGAAVQVNQDAGTNVQAFPTIAVKPDGTGLGVFWYDNRSDPANRRFERFGRVATIAGTTVTFSHDFVIANAPSTPVFGADPVVNAVYMGDYDQATADNAFYSDIFLDTRLGTQDVRYARIPVAGPGVPTIAFVSSNPSSIAAAQNSCTDLFVTVINNGQVTANGVIVSLSSPTPGVTILDSPQPYGDIAAGAQATNAVPFRLSIDGTFACGANIVVDATVNTGDAFSFVIATQGPGYQITTTPGTSIVAGTADVGNHGDDTVTNIPLPFPFTFYGTPHAAANVSSNGNLQFASNSSAFTNDCPLPDASMNELLAALWDDLRTDAGGSGIFTSTSGVAPNRIFNIEWRATYFTGGATANFEIRLHETSGVIDYVYGNLNGNGSSATIGIQNGNGGGPPSDTVQFSCNTGTLSTGLTVTFSPVVGCQQGSGACSVGGACQLACPANQTQSNDPNQCGAVNNYPPPTPTGDCGPILCSPTAGSFFPVGTTTVTCSEQPNGQQGPASCQFTVTINDTQPPTMDAPELVVNTDPGLCTGTATPVGIAADNCPGVTQACTPPGPTFPEGVNPVSCTATDASGNTATDATGSVTVNDLEPPVLTCPADIVEDLPPGVPSGPVSWPDPLVADNCPSPDPATCVPPSGSIFTGGTTTPVNCSALDASGNSGTCSFNVTLNLVSILEIPTASTWGLAALALLLAGAAFVALKRRNA